MVQKYSGRPPVRVFYEFWNRPLSTLNGDHVVSSLIGLCGGTNVFAQTPSIAPAVSVDAVIAANPQVILAGSTDNQQREWAEEWKPWRDIEAVRLGNVFGMDGNLHVRAGPRVLDGAQLICDALETARARMPIKR
jgi:iron complex transport system substrate-binding protein